MKEDTPMSPPLSDNSHMHDRNIYTHTPTHANQVTNDSIEIMEHQRIITVSRHGYPPAFPCILIHALSPDTSSPEAQSPKLTTPIVAGNPTHGRDGGDSGRETKESEP